MVSLFVSLVLIFIGCGKKSSDGAAGGKNPANGPAGAPAPEAPLEQIDNAAHRTNCRSNLNQIGRALVMYAGDNRDWYPNGPAYAGEGTLTASDFYGNVPNRAGGFELLRVNSYLCDYAVYVCPSTSVKPGRGNDSLSWTNAGSGSGKANLSYAYKAGMIDGDSVRNGRAGSGISADLTGDAGVDSNGGKANHTKYGNILFLDGHVSSFDGLGWFSPECAGYPKYKVGSHEAMAPNTLRNPKTGTF